MRFGPHWAARCHPTAHVATVLQHIRDCRTPALGGHVTVCPECGEEHTLYHSCRDRHCPRCQYAQREAWLLSRKEELLPVTYFHVVFTVPDALNGFILGHQEESYKALFHAAWDTLNAFGEKAGVRLGMTALLHTWGSALVFHPHLHCIVPGGGRRLGNDGWKNLPQVKDGDREPFLFPVKALGDMFRAKYMAALSAVEKVPAPIRARCFSKPWVIYAKSPVSGPESTLEYLSRYAYRVAIGDRRILAVDEGTVTFEYKDYKDGGRNKPMTLSGVEFVRRYARHVLPYRFVHIRHYGILAPGNREVLAALQTELGALALARAQMNAHPEKPELRELYQNLMRESAEMERDSDAYIMFTKVYDRRRDMEALQYLLKESQRRGYYEDALMYIDEMRKKVGNNPALVMQEYEVLLRMERKERAYSLIQEAAQAFPKSYDINLAACRVKMSIASEAMKEERYRDAIEPLSFVQKYCVEPDYKASAARRLFLCYKSINDMDNAEIMLRERMYFDPPYLINIERASLYADKGRKEEALDILYSAWKATPKDSIQQRKVIAGAYGEVALPYLRQSREEGASPRVVDICDIMLEMDSTDYWALRYASGAAKDPAMYIECGFDIYPNDVYFRTKKAARLSQYEGRHLEALEMLQPLVDEFPGDEVIEGVHTDIVLRYTRELLKTKSFNEVAPVLDSALVQHPENKELRYERGVLFEKQRQWDSAYVYQASYQPSFLEQKEYKAKMNALLSRSYKNHVEASLDIMRFADTDQLTGMANIYYSRKWARNLWSIRFGYTGRDVTLDPEEGTNPDAFLGGRGLLAGLGWSRDFNAKWSLAINGAFANQYFPNLSADATLTRHFANELDAELGAVYRLIEEENSFMGVSAGVNKMWEHVFLGGKVMGGLMHEKLFINGSARFRFYPYYGGKSFLEFQAGGGTAPELSFLNYYYDPAVYNHLNTFLSLGGHWMLAANLEVSTSLSWSTLYNLASEKVNYRNLFIGNVSFSFAF